MLRKFLNRIDPADVVRLVMFVGGMGSMAYGCWLMYAPAGFMVGGALMFGCAVIGAIRAKGAQ